MHESILLVLALILLTGSACQWLAWRLKLPAIIFLLGCGILAGPVMGWLNPDQLLGELLFPLVALAVAVILFEGSLTLKFRDIPGLRTTIHNLITFGVLISWVIATVTTRWLMDFSWEIAALFGAIIVVTGPTVIMPLLRTVRANENVSNVLLWEGILIDPIGAILAVLVYNFIIAGGLQGGISAGLLVFGKILLIGLGLGIGGGELFAVLLRRYWVPHFLHNIIALALVCGIFTCSDILEAESGLLSVTVMGVWLANRRDLDLEDILNFKETLSILLVSLLFIILAARMDPAGFTRLGWPALGVFAAIQFVVRPLTVQLCALGSQLSLAERNLLSWIAPRGIVAAAMAALFSIKLEAIGYAEAGQLVPLTFLVIIGTVLLQSFSAGFVADRLGVREPEARGFLIVGANPVAQAVAKALQENDFRVQLTDQNWTAVREAKMKGLPAYWGNPVSEHAERHLNLVGIGHLLALSTQAETNALAARYYRLEFEPQLIYSIRLQSGEGGKAESHAEIRYGGRPLFGRQVTYQSLAERLQQGATIRKTRLTEEFSMDELLADPGRRRLPLFAIDAADNIHVVTDDDEMTPTAGWTVLALADPPDQT